MSSLYQIAEDYESSFQHLTSILETENLDDTSRTQLITDSLADIQIAFEQKALTVAAFVANLKLELLGVKDAEERIIKRRRALEKHIDWLSDYLLTQFQRLGLKKISNAELVVSLKKLPASVVIEDESLIPSDFKEVVESVKISKTAIASALKQGHEVAGCYLNDNGQRLDIR